MTTKHSTLTTLGLATLAAAGLTACSSGSSDSTAGRGGGDTGTLTVSLMDAPVFDAEEVWICITQVNIKPEDGAPTEFPLEDADGEATSCDGEQLDLLTLTNPADAVPLIDGEDVEAGAYEWIELEVDAAMPGGGADADGDYDSYVVDSTGGQHVLRVPSGSVRLVSGFTVTAGQHARFTLDWDLRGGLTNPVGQAGYLLRPAFRIIDESEYGTLSGTVSTELITGASGDLDCTLDDPDIDVGNVVYLFALEGPDESLEPDDNDGVAPDAYATLEVEPNDAATAYEFETIVAPGDYRVAFTCQGDRDDPEVNENDPNEADDEQPDWDVEFLDPDGEPNITVVEDETTTVSFTTLPTT